MSKERLFCALVIKDKLAVGTFEDKGVPDVKFCWAKNYDDARHIFANANWPQAYWVKDKSVCRLLKIFEVFSEEFFAGEKLPSDILNIEVLRSLPVEQVEGRSGVKYRVEEDTESLEESPKSRRRKKKPSERTKRRLEKVDEAVGAAPSRRRRKKSIDA